MSITFGHTTAENFAQIFSSIPRELTRNPYVNYLRHYKMHHPSYDLQKILRYGSIAWRKLKPSEKRLFTQKNVLASISSFGRSLSSQHARPIPIPKLPIPQRYKRRSLKASQNIRRSRRKSQYLPKRHDKKFPNRIQYKNWLSHLDDRED